jgi:recombinational DNA repair protein RecT
MTTNLPAERRPMTEVERARVEREKAKDAMVALVRDSREDIERSLRVYEIDADRFLAAIEVGITQGLKASEDFCTGDHRAFLQAAARAAHVGLLPDGKQGAIVKYARDYTFQPMVEGFVEVIWKTGLVTDVNHNVVCEGDEFDFEEGDNGYVRHKRSLTRPADAPVIGAWCVINLQTGGKLIEIVDRADLEKIASVNRSTKGPRGTWGREMHRKSPFRRIVKRMPKTERLSVLIEVDDRNVRLETAHTIEEPAIPRSQLFANRAAVRKPKAAQDVVDPPSDDGLPVKEVETLSQDQGDPAAGNPVAGGGFVLKAKLRPGKGRPPAEYADVDMWFGDISNMLKRLKDTPVELRGFWTLNRPFVDEAGLNGHGPAAMRLIEQAQELGAIEGESHAG